MQEEGLHLGNWPGDQEMEDRHPATELIQHDGRHVHVDGGPEDLETQLEQLAGLHRCGIQC